MALRTLKVNSLSHSGGVITAVLNGVTFTVTLSGLTANTLYMIYFTSSGLVISTNVNSVGPAGFSGWQLVGAFYSSGASAFGAFITVNGVPKMSDWITWTPSITGTPGAVTNLTAQWMRNIDKLFATCRLSTTGAGPVLISLPNATVKHPDTTNYRYYGGGYITTVGPYNAGVIARGNDTSVALALPAAGSSNGQTPYANYVAETHLVTFEVPIIGWSGTPLADL